MAPGEKLTDSEAPVKGDPAPILDYPALYDDKMISPARAEAYLVAALTHAQSEEISSAYAYGEQPQNPGFGVHFHNESKIYCPFVFTARQGQSRGSRAFDLQAAF
ncbi:hypothetical protein [Streptomyces sp. NBC_00239]|uniref:hypothetical protein n=1 Tax=Streptomyces sp. NBC_00239 TaxID=2903640 RepID=UPI002E2D535E|nr:hypothetical protein [Streptomyces sp. NBC_00239]